MKLTLKFKLPECETYDVEVGGEKKEVNSTESTAVFALTAVFRGIFYIVTMGLPQFDGLYGEKWWTSIRPYRLYVELTVQVSGDTEKTIDIKNAEYAKGQNIWLPPSASTQSPESSAIHHSPGWFAAIARTFISAFPSKVAAFSSTP